MSLNMWGTGSRARRARASGKARGYALVEALVAVMVIGVAFIGASRMQTVGMRLNDSGQSRQKAIMLTYQLADRVRANVTANYSGVATGAKTCLTATAGCTPAQLAIADFTEWRDDVSAQLKGGDGYICIDSTPNDGTSSASPACDGTGTSLAIKVWWTDNIGASRFTASIRP